MGQNSIRKDFLIDRYSIIAEGRGNRPIHFDNEVCESDGKVCFFCPGNESLTPPEITRVSDNGGWLIRVFNNKFPALSSPEGEHEIIVDTNKHCVELEHLTEQEMRQVFEMYEERRKKLEEKYMYAFVFKNKGKLGGASLPHSHTQVLAMQSLPHLVARENEKAEAHYYTKGKCPFCEHIGSIEKTRIAYETESIIAITPNAPRFPYELWIFPRRHLATFSDFNDKEKTEFLSILKKAITKLVDVSGDVPYNFYLHAAPKGSERWYHFHLELLPRLSSYAGFELGAETYICTISPESAAQYYKS